MDQLLQDNLKSPNIKETLDVCGICGENHSSSECTLIAIKTKVVDSVVPTKARLTLPNCVFIETMADQNYCIVAKTFIESGTKFGPLEAQNVFTLDSNINLPLKIFNSTEDSEYYLNTCDENTCNWLMFVSSAQNAEEQNLICFQEGLQIFYVTIKEVKKGDQLRAWYSPYYALKMKKNLLSPQGTFENHTQIKNAVEPMVLDNLIKGQQQILARENWTCKFCGQVEKYVPQFAKHIRQHYVDKDKQYAKTQCDLCNKSFKTPTLCRRHLKVAHEKSSRIRMKSQKPVFKDSDVNNKDILIGGPLLNNMLSDSIDNTGLLLPNTDLAELSPALPNNLGNENILLDMSFNVDNLLNDNVKELDQFNFDVNDSQEQFVCDICLHSFSDLYRFLQHLNKHTGKFTCLLCMKVFCRKENLNAHNCTTITFACEICQKLFKHKKHLIRHIKSAHIKKFSCKNCNRYYYSQGELKQHNCISVPNESKPKFTCTICNKVFFLKKYLQKHLKTHNSTTKQGIKFQRYICATCGKVYTSIYGFNHHRKTHKEYTHVCKICYKRFHRIDVFKNHVARHKNVQVKELSCHTCNLTFKNARMLAFHRQKQHSILPKIHKCDKCNKAFTERYLLVKHKSKYHTNICPHCCQHFETEILLKSHVSVHTDKVYECPVCSSKMKLRSSLSRHLKKLHPDHIITVDISQMKIAKSNIGCQSEKKDDEVVNLTIFGQNNTQNGVYADLDNYSSCQSILDNFEDILNGCNSNDSINLLNNSHLNEGPADEEQFEFEDFGIDLQSHMRTQNVQNTEICLSMPDITEAGQEVALGDNAYMLEDGTILQPSDGSELVVYLTK